MNVQELIEMLDAYQPTREVVVEFHTRQGPVKTVKIDSRASIVCDGDKIQIIEKEDTDDSSGID